MAALAVRQKQIDANGFSTMRSASPRAHTARLMTGSGNRLTDQLQPLAASGARLPSTTIHNACAAGAGRPTYSPSTLPLPKDDHRVTHRPPTDRPLLVVRIATTNPGFWFG